MLTEQDIRERWGEALIEIPGGQLPAGFVLPQETTEFLVNVGLPANEEITSLALSFEVNPQKLSVINFAGEQYLVLGSNPISKFCLKHKSGEVFSLRNPGHSQSKLLFANASLTAFLLFIITYLDYDPLFEKQARELRKPVEGIPSEDVREIARKRAENWLRLVQEMERRFLEIDPLALSTKELGHTYWSLELDELKMV